MTEHRSTSRVLSGPFRETRNPNQRFKFVQQIVDAFWRKWIRDFFPSLIVLQKWHTNKRKVRVGVCSADPRSKSGAR